MKLGDASEAPASCRRILLLSFFFPPDLCAGSFRARALVDALLSVGGESVRVDVVTTHPNRYHTHQVVTTNKEEQGGLRIYRLPLPPHRGGFFEQARAFRAYAQQVWRLAGEQHYDLVVATSSRLVTAVLGACISHRQGVPLYLDLRDPFVETIGELFPKPVSLPLRWCFGGLERYALNRAGRVNLVAEGLLGYFQPRYPQRDFALYTNGVDSDIVSDCAASASVADVDRRPLRVLYAGNVGAGQGLHQILPELAHRLCGRVEFRVVGGGGQLDQLRRALAAAGVDNVELLDPVPRERLRELYAWADVLFLHLSGMRSMRRVLPSKLFEYAATGKPVWAGVGGYAAAFIRRELDNVALFEPGDTSAAERCLGSLQLGQAPREDFARRYRREDIMRRMAVDVLTLLD